VHKATKNVEIEVI